MTNYTIHDDGSITFESEPDEATRTKAWAQAAERNQLPRAVGTTTGDEQPEIRETADQATQRAVGTWQPDEGTETA